MANCDICNAVMDVNEGVAYTIEELQELVRRGFGPPDKVVRAARSAGWTTEQIMAKWRQELDARPQPYWMLCPSCAARAVKYLPAEAALTVPAENAPVSQEQAAPPAAVAEAPAEAAVPVVAEEGIAGEEIPFPEEAALEARPPGKRPPSGRLFLVGLLIGLLGGVALGLFFLDRYVHPAPIVSPTAAPVPTPPPTPTRPFPTKRPVTPQPTEALYPPTAIAVPNVSGAIPTLDDMPAGFRAMPAERQAALGLSQEALAPAFALAQGRLRLHWAFDHRSTGEVAVGFLVYPLTPAEQDSFDRGLAGADGGLAALWSALARHGWGMPERVARLDRVGQAGLWLSSTGSGDAAGLLLDILVARRGALLEFVMAGYPAGQFPQADPLRLIRRLDTRLAAVVRPSGRPPLSPTATPTPLPDLSAAVLLVGDLPAGFTAMPPSEMAKSGLTAEALAQDADFRALDLATAGVHNVVAFADNTSPTPALVMGCLIYPLTELEMARLDRDIANPQLGVGFWSALLGKEGLTAARALEGMGGIADGSAGLTALDSKSKPALRSEVVLVRRGPIVEVIMLAYQDKNPPRLEIRRLAEALDRRLAVALKK